MDVSQTLGRVWSWGRQMTAQRLVAASLAVALAFAQAGCQVHVAGQTLPSSHYMDDDVQYFPPGEEFLLANEARALAEHEAQYRARGSSGMPGVAPAPAPMPPPAPGAAPAPAPMQ